MSIELRVPRPDELDAWRISVIRGFAQHPRPEPQEADMFRRRVDLSRSLAALDDGQIVGTATVFPYQLTLPGGAVVPAAGVTMVTVAATHRRQGILRTMMSRQLADIRELGEPLAILWASESSIYGRFGYGLAILHERWTIDRRHATFAHVPPTPGSVRWVTEQDGRTLFSQVWDQTRAGRPGMTDRDELGWERFFYDPEYMRFGGSASFFGVYEEGGRPGGYVAYRIKQNWVDGTSAHTVMVSELIAATDAAYAALWRFLLNIDLTLSVESWGRPVNEPLMWMLADPRRLQRTPHDAIWVRLIDVTASLEKRTYAVPGRVVLEVTDPFCPWVAGRYALDGGPEGAVCRATKAEPDLVMSAADLATIYMGGNKMSPLARAGRVEERSAGALARADAMFATDPSPWCPQGF